MPYDPAFPPANALLVSAQFRDQFTGLHSLITSIPVGPQGPQGIPGNDGLTGPQGPPFANALVDGVTTLNPGESATVSVSFDGTDVHFSYGIPRGADGATGADGPQGPPFAGAIVDATNTLNPGVPASVSVSFDGTDVHFTFGIPQGEQGP